MIKIIKKQPLERTNGVCREGMTVMVAATVAGGYCGATSIGGYGGGGNGF